MAGASVSSACWKRRCSLYWLNIPGCMEVLYKPRQNSWRGSSSSAVPGDMSAYVFVNPHSFGVQSSVWILTSSSQHCIVFFISPVSALRSILSPSLYTAKYFIPPVSALPCILSLQSLHNPVFYPSNLYTARHCISPVSTQHSILTLQSLHCSVFYPSSLYTAQHFIPPVSSLPSILSIQIYCHAYIYFAF